MLYVSEAWCLGQNGIGILQRTERAMVKSMCGKIIKEVEKKILQMLNLNEAMDLLTRFNGVCWYGHVLKNYRNFLGRRALDFKVKGTKKIDRPKKPA